MNLTRHIAACFAAVLVGASSIAAAEEHAFTEGQVVTMYSIRTEPGKFEEYMNFLQKIWKPTQDAARKHGYVLSSSVIKVEPRGENDPDIYLVVYYKNWAALDGAAEKADVVAREVEGSLAAANESTVGRARIRRLLGSWTGQQLDLK